MATKALASWAVQTQPDSLPPTVQRAALRSLYNYIGCTIGGSNHPTVTKAHDALSPLFGPSTTPLLGHTGTVKPDAQHAALLNGIASHVHDYDDAHLATIIHPTGPVASAILALSSIRGPITGSALLCALTAGIEAACKLGLAVWPSHYDIGWHITSTTGSIGAAVACGRLLHLNETQMAHAIGLAAVQVTGLREMFGSDTKSFHPGCAAQSGLLAALLAEKGYTSSETALEAKCGWANVVIGGPGTPKLDHFVEQLGKIWEIESNAFKPFPCGIVCHPAIDACIRLRRKIEEKGLDLKRLRNVHAKVHPLVIELTSKRKPKDGLEGKFSVFHGCAVGLLYGKAGPAQYADAVVTSDEVVEIRDRIDATPDENIAADETLVIAEFEGGEVLEEHVRHAIGSLGVPMSDEQLTDKFVDQSALVLGEAQAKAVSDAAWKIGEAEDVAQILETM